MKRKPVVQIERMMSLDLLPDKELPLHKRVIPTPPGKQKVIITRLDWTTMKQEARVYIVRRELASKLQGILAAKRPVDEATVNEE